MLKATDGNTTVYYTRGFELISRREGSAASYYVYDCGLSVRALTNEAGTVTDTLVFDAFGNETGRTGTTDNPYGFQGEEQDSTGLYYLRARYMDPATGTFTTMDTYGGRMSDPMSLHKYLFANSNPVMYSDPSGHYTLEDSMKTIVIQSILQSACDGITYIVQNLAKGDNRDKGWDFWTNVVDAFGMGLVKGFVSGVFADKIQYLVSLLPPLVFILEAIVGYGIWERMNYIDKAMNDLFDDDKSNDSVAVWEVIENSGLIFYEMWDFFGFIGKEFPNYDLSPATDAFSGTDYGESSGMVILPNGGNSPSGSNALSPSPNSDSGSNCVVVYFYVPFYGVKPTIRSAT